LPFDELASHNIVRERNKTLFYTAAEPLKVSDYPKITQLVLNREKELVP
jgi:hypothetical protein